MDAQNSAPIMASVDELIDAYRPTRVTPRDSRHWWEFGDAEFKTCKATMTPPAAAQILTSSSPAQHLALQLADVQMTINEMSQEMAALRASEEASKLITQRALERIKDLEAVVHMGRAAKRDSTGPSLAVASNISTASLVQNFVRLLREAIKQQMNEAEAMCITTLVRFKKESAAFWRGYLCQLVTLSANNKTEIQCGIDVACKRVKQLAKELEGNYNHLKQYPLPKVFLDCLKSLVDHLIVVLESVDNAKGLTPFPAALPPVSKPQRSTYVTQTQAKASKLPKTRLTPMQAKAAGVDPSATGSNQTVVGTLHPLMLKRDLAEAGFDHCDNSLKRNRVALPADDSTHLSSSSSDHSSAPKTWMDIAKRPTSLLTRKDPSTPSTVSPAATKQEPIVKQEIADDTAYGANVVDKYHSRPTMIFYGPYKSPELAQSTSTPPVVPSLTSAVLEPNFRLQGAAILEHPSYGKAVHEEATCSTMTGSRWYDGPVEPVGNEWRQSNRSQRSVVDHDQGPWDVHYPPGLLGFDK